MDRSDNRRAALAPLMAFAAVLSVAGCAPAEPSGNDIVTASIAPAQTAGAATPSVPGESLEARLARLEYDLAELKLDYSIVRPDFERLVARETELSQRVEALELASGPLTAAVPAGSGARTQDEELAAAPPSPARPSPARPDTAAGEGVGLHLASYRSRDRLADGWDELRAAHPAELGALTVRIQRIDTGSGGVFQRLVAGPVASQTAAEGMCRSLSARGVYCETLPFTGDAL